jgi:hypothetical protein
MMVRIKVDVFWLVKVFSMNVSWKSLVQILKGWNMVVSKER